jgi:hypothetical protein
MAFTSDVIAELSKLDLHHLEGLIETYEARADSASASAIRRAIATKGQVQTNDLYNSGQLFKTSRTDPETGRLTHTFTGDPMAWMEPYTKSGVRGRYPVENWTGANSPEARALAAKTQSVVVEPGYRIAIVKDDARSKK